MLSPYPPVVFVKHLSKLGLQLQTCIGIRYVPQLEIPYRSCQKKIPEGAVISKLIWIYRYRFDKKIVFFAGGKISKNGSDSSWQWHLHKNVMFYNFNNVVKDNFGATQRLCVFPFKKKKKKNTKTRVILINRTFQLFILQRKLQHWNFTNTLKKTFSNREDS